jgi:hypothetical protein
LLKEIDRENNCLRVFVDMSKQTGSSSASQHGRKGYSNSSRSSRLPRNPRDELGDDERIAGRRHDGKTPPLVKYIISLIFSSEILYHSIRRPTSTFELPPDDPYKLKDDSEARTAARHTARDFGFLSEEKLGEGPVMERTTLKHAYGSLSFV